MQKKLLLSKTLTDAYEQQIVNSVTMINSSIIIRLDGQDVKMTNRICNLRTARTERQQNSCRSFPRNSRNLPILPKPGIFRELVGDCGCLASTLLH